MQLTLATLNSTTPASQTHARRLQRLNVPRESSWRHSRSSQDPPMGGCYKEDSPFPQVRRSSRPFPPRSSKPPSNCLPACLLKQVEPTPDFFFFCSSGSCDAYSPFLRWRCCCCCFINSIFFFFNSSASSCLYSPSSTSEAPSFSASSSSSTPLLLLILILALLLPMLLLLLLHQLHQSATSKTDLRQKLSRNCSICRLLLFLFFVLLQHLCFFRCLLFSFTCSRRRRCCCFINSNQTATSKNGFAAPKKRRTLPKLLHFPPLLILLFQPLCFFRYLLFSFTCSRCSPLLQLHQLHQSSNFTNGFCHKRILRESYEECLSCGRFRHEKLRQSSR